MAQISFLSNNFSVTFTLTMYTFIAFTILINPHMTSSQNNLLRSKRNALQLSTLVEEYTKYNPLKLLHYGNWCGKGSDRMKDGSYIDDCDLCCKMHDNCYRKTRKLPPYCTLAIYRTYNYETNVNGEPFCSNDNEMCPGLLCQCDMEFLKCLSKEPCKLSEQNSGSSLTDLLSWVKSFG